MFNCTSFYKDCIWYLPELDLAAVTLKLNFEYMFSLSCRRSTEKQGTVLLFY